VTAQDWYTLLVLAVAVERLAELVVSRRNLRWSLAHGGVEHGAGHYPVMVVLHVGLLVGCLVETRVLGASAPPALAGVMVVLVLLSQALRWWCITALGHRWCTRIVVVPGMPPVTSGPYRHLRHPNYVAVVVEGIALPLAGGAWVTAVVFTALNSVLLRHRIRIEDAALATLPQPAPARDAR
jgi:methyltransferase